MAIIHTNILFDVSQKNGKDGAIKIAEALLKRPALHFIDGQVALRAETSCDQPRNETRELVIFTPDEKATIDNAEDANDVRAKIEDAVEFFNTNNFAILTLRNGNDQTFQWIELAAVMKKAHEIAAEQKISIPHSAVGMFDNLLDRPITTASARGDSGLISEGAYKQIADEGRAYIDKLQHTSTYNPPLKMNDEDWNAVKHEIHKAVQKDWGGATVDIYTGEIFPTGVDRYSVSVRGAKPAVITVKERPSFEELSNAIEAAIKTYNTKLTRAQHYLGVFYDVEQKRVDIDPVVVVTSRDLARKIGAAFHSIGGAFSFKDYFGYYPPHVAHADQAVQRLRGAIVPADMANDEGVRSFVMFDSKSPAAFASFRFNKGQIIDLNKMDLLVVRIARAEPTLEMT